MALPYYPRYPRDFLDGTAAMTFELKGAYAILLDIIYAQDGSCPDNDRYISGLLGCSIRAWKNYKNQLLELGKITIENGIISNFRADKELIKSRLYQEKMRENGLKPKKNKDLEKPKLSQTETETKTYIKKEIKKKKSCSFESLKIDTLPDDWLAYSRTKNLSLAQAQTQFEKFSNFWIGNGGLKTDWLATWRSWIINQIDKYGLKPEGTQEVDDLAVQEFINRVIAGQSIWTSNHTLKYRMTEAQAKDKYPANIRLVQQ